MKKWKNEKMMVGMQGIGWCDIGMGFRCVSGCSAVWVEIGAECVARESGVGWRIFANFGGIVATPLAFRAEMLANRRALCVTLHHRDVPRERIYQKMTKLLFDCYMGEPRWKGRFDTCSARRIYFNDVFDWKVVLKNEDFNGIYTNL